MAYRDVILADSPLDFYEMETSTGTDSGSGGRTLTLSGGVTTDVVGIIGDGWSFDGTNDYASMATWPTLTTAFTFEAWVKPNLSGVNDTPTVIRRDGTDIHLLRVRGSALGVNPGQAEVFADGLTLVSGSSYRVDDGNWHHLVYTQSGNTAKLYVDGVERASGTTSQSTFSMGTGTGYIGAANGSGEYYKGVMDNVAIYNTALNSTKVAAHYAAAISNGGYTAQVMAATAAMPDPAINYQRRETVVVTDDAYTDENTFTTNYGTADSLYTRGFSGNRRFIYLKPVAPTLGTGETVVSATLVLTPTVSAGSIVGNFQLYTANSTWAEGTLTHNIAPTRTLVSQHTISSLTAGTAIRVPLGTSYSATNGIAFYNADNAIYTFASAENATAGYRPSIEYVIQTPTPGGYSAQAMTASAVMPPHTANAGTGVSPSITPMTASATLVDPNVSAGAVGGYVAQPFYASVVMPNATVSADKDAVIEAESMDAYATWPTSTGFTLSVSIAAEAMAASATTVDASVATQQGPRISAGPMTATANWKQPSAINGVAIVASEIDDKFFQRVMSDGPYSWYRFNDAGSTAIDRMQESVDSTLAYYEGGVLTGRNDGPDARHSVRFTGSGFFREHNDIQNVDIRNTRPERTLEFYIRTDKKNQYIAYSGDTTPTTGILYLKDGRIHQKEYNNTTGVLSDAFTGFTDIADGKWHQISLVTRKDIASVQDSTTDGLYVYIDGKFEIRRWVSASPWVGIPDYVGSLPAGTFINPGVPGVYVAPTVPSSENFVGDMSEMVLYNKRLTEDSLTRHFYDFMAWTPIEATSMDAFAFTPADSRGRGNQKRALYLWWDGAVDAYNILGGNGFTGDMNHDPILDGHGNFGVYNLEDYKVFSKSVSLTSGFELYTDNVYDQPTLIDLDYHVDINDYDVIMFGDWPDEGIEDDYYAARFPRYREDKERLLRQLRDANDSGIGLMVTHPRMAIDLGIVDRVELVPTLKEYKNSPLQGNAAGLYDYGSAVKFPWNITSDAGLGGFNSGAFGTGAAQNNDPAFLASKAFYYEDMNFNNKFRVRALISGLTDIPSYMIRDAVFHVDRDVYGDTVAALDLVDRRNGLVIGDEFIFHGTNPAGMDWGSADYDGERTGRSRGSFAVPLANVKAGTVVTTFGTTHYRDANVVENPYKDYATTIVLDRGDVLGGRAVGGRIFVSFTEQPNRFNLTLPANILPGSEWDDGTAVWPNSYPIETNAQRNWEFSETRMSATNTPLAGRLVETVVTMPDGTTSVSRGSSAGGLVYANYTQLFGIAVIPKWDMTRRGLWWVGRGEKPVEGELRVAAEPMTATASMPEPVVSAQRDNTYVAEPMRALAQMPRVAESTIGDAQIVTLPMTAVATFTGYSRVISAAPMLATAEFVENFDMVHASGEQVVLTLHGVDATLYLKEEN